LPTLTTESKFSLANSSEKSSLLQDESKTKTTDIKWYLNEVIFV
jgi:hypothetical protein